MFLIVSYLAILGNHRNRNVLWIQATRRVLFINDTESKGRKGLLHHWIIIRPWDNFVIGLIGFDRITRSGKALWNLGYWVRSSEQQHGFARLSVEAVLKWIAESGPVCIELKVDPNNKPGHRTVLRVVKEWNGERYIAGDSAITISGLRTLHHCYLVNIIWYLFCGLI